MDIVSIMRLFYLIYTVYTLFVMSVSDYNFFHAFFGLLATWIVYFAFVIGYKGGKRRVGDALLPTKSQTNVPFFNITEWKPVTYVFNVILCWGSVLLSSKFYTGKTIGQVINGLISGESLYLSYQLYFRRNNIAAFSASKIIYILMLTYVTIVFIYSFTSIILSEQKLGVGKILFLFFIGASYFYFGISRGTNIEMYMIFILLSYCILNRRSKNGGSTKSLKTIFIVGILGIVSVLLFRLVLTARGSVFVNNICEEISFDNDSLIAELFPTITNIALSLFSYLGYGIYAIGVMISDVFLQSPTNAMASMMPFGYEILEGESLSKILTGMIEVGVRWVPDWINLVGVFGFPLFIFAMVAFGWLAGRIITSDLPPMLTNICCVFIFLQMLAIPVGNFIFNNTPTLLTIWFTIGCCIWSKWFKNFRRIKVIIKF